MLDFLRIRTIEESLDELSQALGTGVYISLDKAVNGGADATLAIIKRQLNTYLASLEGLKLVISDTGSAVDKIALDRAKASMELTNSLTDVLNQLGKENKELGEANRHASQALRNEGMFSPKSLYRIKEDLEAVSQLHARFKKETKRLVEEGQIATRRNAELRLENERLQDRITCLELGDTSSGKA